MRPIDEQRNREIRELLQGIKATLDSIYKELNLKNENDARHYQEETEHRNRAATIAVPHVPVEVHSLPTPSDEDVAYEGEKRTRERERFTVEKWTLIVLAVYTAFTLCLVLLNREQISNSRDSFDKTFHLMREEQDDGAIATGDILIKMQAQTRAQGRAADAMADQVKKLQAGVMETHALAKATRDAVDTNLRLSNEDKRAWVGVQQISCDKCDSTIGGPGQPNTVIVGDLYIWVINTGKTPAVDMIISHVLITNRPQSQPIPSFGSDTKDQSQIADEMVERLRQGRNPLTPEQIEVAKRDLEPPKQILAPNAPLKIVIASGAVVQRNVQDRMVEYGLVKITYYDTGRETLHSTMVCVMNDWDSEWKFCPTGNDMN